MRNEIEIQQLLEACLAKDDKARRRLYDLYVGRLYHVTNRVTNNHHDTEDVLQQAFVKVFNKLETFNGKYGSVYSWMCRICINEAISLLRKKKLTFLEITDQIYVHDSKSNMLDEMSVDYIAEAIQKLSDTQRVIFTLYEVEGYSHDEIAIKLDINPATSRSYLSRAKIKLKSLLSEKLKKINSL